MHMQEIVFFEEGEPLIDGEPGDLKFLIRTRPHPRFERAGHDLKYNLTISLIDALTGFSTEVNTLLQTLWLGYLVTVVYCPDLHAHSFHAACLYHIRPVVCKESCICTA